jgi:exodeoxyribonuclease VII large subunit
MPDTLTTNNTYSVTDLCEKIKRSLTQNIGLVTVIGEVSNLTIAHSGHAYFTLKDQHSQIRCVFFKRYQMSPRLELVDGESIQVSGQISLYEARGDLQMLVYKLTPVGEGALQIQFDELKKKLEAEGLFSQDRKKQICQYPKKIALITSNKGAAVHDFCSVAKSRFPITEIDIYDTPVQGAGAHINIIKALKKADKNYDVIIITRGGGSIEDLWGFNNEALAREIFKCQTPVVSAVGHEIDFTIADFVADLRAPTPSAAAQIILPDQFDLQQRLDQYSQSLFSQVRYIITNKQNQLNKLQQRLIHPKDKIILQKEKLKNLKSQLKQNIDQILKYKKQSLSQLENELKIISPKATLNRGYAIVKDQKSKVIDSVNKVKSNAPINIIFKDGNIDAICK